MLRQNKKGISIMVGYVLLVTFAIIMSVIIYTQLKTHIPKETAECPDGVSLFIKDYQCSTSQLNLTLENNGRFDIGGYFIYATNSSDQELATLDISSYIITGGTPLNPGVKFRGIKNSFGLEDPWNEIIHIFNLTAAGHGRLYSLEITPIRWQTIENKERVVTCTQAKIRQEITCS